MDEGGFRIEHAEGGRVRLFGELDAASVPVLADALQRIDREPIEFDCSELTFVDSSGLRALASAATDRRVRIVAPQPSVLRTLRIVGVDKIDTIEVVAGAEGA